MAKLTKSKNSKPKQRSKQAVKQDIVSVNSIWDSPSLFLKEYPNLGGIYKRLETFSQLADHYEIIKWINRVYKLGLQCPK